MWNPFQELPTRHSDIDELFNQFFNLPSYKGGVGTRLTSWVPSMEGFEKDGQRPSPASSGHLDKVHVNGIKIGSFFPVHLDVDEVFIHQQGNFFILKGLILHDVAPMSGRISNAQ